MVHCQTVFNVDLRPLAEPEAIDSSSSFAMTTSPLRMFCDISTLLIWSGCGGSSLSCNDFFLRLVSFLFLLYRWYLRELCFSFLLRLAARLACSFLATDSKSTGNEGACWRSFREFIENKLIDPCKEGRHLSPVIVVDQYWYQGVVVRY